MEKKINAKEYTTSELQKEFTVLGFGYGYCAVMHKESNVKGSFDFKATDDGRKYFGFSIAN